MILKQTRVQVGGSSSLLAHITNEEDNDLVTVLHGNDSIPRDGDIIARMNNRKYGNRHIVISPQFALSPEKLNFVLALVFDELDPQGGIGEDYLLIQHNKRRHDGLHDAPHYHLVINESTTPSVWATHETCSSSKKTVRLSLTCVNYSKVRI